jgi:hypothetical protein
MAALVRRLAVSLSLLLTVVALTASSAATSAHSALPYRSFAEPNRPLVTAVLDPASLGGPEAGMAYRNLRRTGARFVRIVVIWAQVAPAGSRTPPGFNARDPRDHSYRWEVLDEQVQRAVAEGFTPIVYVQSPPRWAQSCTANSTACRPNPRELAAFMTAAARRYSGTFARLPRIRYWQIWNEPNLPAYLSPQYDAKGRPVSPAWYRWMVNAAYDALHAVRKDNVVIAGGQSPFGPDRDSPDRVAPLTLMRLLLCLSSGTKPKPVCNRRVHFDVWAHHPYTSGGPMHHADGKNDVSLPDLWKMKVLLDAGVQSGNLVSRGPVRFWVTEFAWDTNPPDPNAMPERLHARWVAEALYRMWDQGVSLVTWFQIRDQPFAPSTPFQSGLYFRGSSGIESDTPKLALRAFRFPFVAFRDDAVKGIWFWGRSPAGRATVVVEQLLSGKWGVVTSLRPSANGTFSGKFAGDAGTSWLQARLANGKDQALPFSLAIPPDRPGCAWGTC